MPKYCWSLSNINFATSLNSGSIFNVNRPYATEHHPLINSQICGAFGDLAFQKPTNGNLTISRKCTQLDKHWRLNDIAYFTIRQSAKCVLTSSVRMCGRLTSGFSKFWGMLKRPSMLIYSNDLLHGASITTSWSLCYNQVNTPHLHVCKSNWGHIYWNDFHE